MCLCREACAAPSVGPATDVLALPLAPQSLLPPAEAPALDLFFQRTVGAADDVRDATLRSGARLNLPLGWVPDAIASCNYVLSEPPTKQQVSRAACRKRCIAARCSICGL